MATPTSADPISSLAERLGADLEAFVDQMDHLLDASEILHRPHPRNSDVFFVGWHDYRWGSVDDRQRQMQRSLLEAWRPWMEQLRLLFSSDSSATQKHLDEADAFVRGWIDRNRANDHSIPRTIPEAKQRFRERVKVCGELLQSLDASRSETIVVPDSNVLIKSPDVATYGRVLGTQQYTVVLVPATLAELDKLKITHSNPTVREKARKFNGRIKDWRARGNLVRGVKVQGDVWVRAEGREPNFSATLSWLDPNVADDRLLASVFEVQRRHPTSRVVLLTGDVNLLAKADTARIPTADTPDPEPE